MPHRSAVTTPAQKVFDGHNDTLLRLWRQAGADPVAAFLEGGRRGHIDLPKAVTGGLAGGLFAMFVPSDDSALALGSADRVGYDLPLPPGVDLGTAQRAIFSMTAILLKIETASAGRVRVCRSVDDIRRAMAADVLAAVMHIEGAEAIDPQLDALYALHAAGLRSLGPVWSRSNIFGHGVPFRHPSSPDTGDGLSERGMALVRACNELRIMIDLSHLNEKGFDDVARTSTAPLVATHSNVHALSQSSRNLTDRQLAIIKASDGLVGVNFATSFLRADGGRSEDTPLDLMVDHIAYLIDKIGEDRVALGSDFDGAMMPRDIATAAGLQNLVVAMARRGFGTALIEKVCIENWMRVLAATWGG